MTILSHLIDGAFLRKSIKNGFHNCNTSSSALNFPLYKNCCIAYGVLSPKYSVIKPKMALTLKQGDGRLVRTGRDTGAVAILDCRANLNGTYYGIVSKTLPKRCTTNSIDELTRFFKRVKPHEYFTR